MSYLDASVILAYYLKERYCEQAQHVYRQHTELVCSDLAELEVYSILSRLVRMGSLDLNAARQAGALFDEHLEARLYTRLHLRADHYRWARVAIAASTCR